MVPQNHLQNLQDRSRTSRSISRTSRSTSRTTFKTVLAGFKEVIRCCSRGAVGSF